MMTNIAQDRSHIIRFVRQSHKNICHIIMRYYNELVEYLINKLY